MRNFATVPAKLQMPSRRRYVIAALQSSFLVLSGCARAADGNAPTSLPRVSIMAFGAKGDGTSDDTSAFRLAVAHLSSGGTIFVPDGIYLVDFVEIRTRSITIEMTKNAIIRKSGSAGIESRGIFLMNYLSEADFLLTGGTIDLNGEGPMDIDVPGRIPNLYAAQTIPTVTAIAGPANAAIYAVECAGIFVRGTRIINSGECGLVLRNCGNVDVRDCHFSNLANYGVEFSFIARGIRNPFGPSSHEIGNCTVENCTFQDLDDYGLGSGNGVGVGGGGGARLGVFRRYRIEKCTFLRCQRDIHFEFLKGSRIQNLTIKDMSSTDARQGSIGLIGVHQSVIENCTITNAGGSPTALLGVGEPDIYGIVLSGDIEAVTLSRIRVIDTRSQGVRKGIGASIRKGSNLFAISSGSWTDEDVGEVIGIAAANPAGTPLISVIEAVVSPKIVRLSLRAGASVDRPSFVVGGATRNGIILRNGGSTLLDNVEIIAGSGNKSSGNSGPSALRLSAMKNTVRLKRFRAQPPKGAQFAPIGIDAENSRYSVGSISGDISINGFKRNWNVAPTLTR
jgi:Pectate lyase superfamily protein